MCPDIYTGPFGNLKDNLDLFLQNTENMTNDK